MNLKQILFFLAITAPTSVVSAALVVADFNDLTGGNSNLSGQGGGTGFSGTWSGTATIDVNSGDLVAPASTNFGLSQSGTAQRVDGDFGGSRQIFRPLSTTLGAGGGTIWFSMLFNSQSNTARGGLTFNETASASTFRDHVYIANGFVRLGLDNDGQGRAAFSNNVDNLLLGSLSIDPTGDETISVWVNPDVSGGIGGLGAADATFTENATNLNGGISDLGIISFESTDNAGTVLIDAVRLSDNSDANLAFAEVTGINVIPEPSVALLVACGALGLLRRRRS
ncbi:MAG: hypothetical protein AB8D78_04550 [Akkermansiaceae bacterium]